MNRLASSKSPYLKQHAHNPVDWYPWSDEAIEKAKREGKWIFLSIGYSSCHWCHVMERESFEDPDVAAYLNEHFVSIKVDREERPDIDAIYMEAVQLIAGHGGWPLSAWLTSDLEPVYAGTYFPPVDSHQRPAFMTVLKRLLAIREKDPTMVADRAQKMREALNHDMYANLPAEPLSSDVIANAIQKHKERFDSIHGGFSGAPKFPQAMGLRFLLLTHDSEAIGMSLHTLRCMLRGGIWDAVGGGLHRYSTDHKWLVPHFEKMLYDQSTLLEALATAQGLHSEPLFDVAINDMLVYLDRDMRHPLGGYYSALDADTDGVEGLTYVWTTEEIDALVDAKDQALVRAYYHLEPNGNWEGNHILVRPTPLSELSNALSIPIAELEQRIRSIRQILLDARLKRNQPAIDTKVLTSWNAMLLTSLVETWKWTSNEKARVMAADLANVLMSAVDDSIVYRVSYDGVWEQPGFLDDYANLAIAFFNWYSISGDDTFLEQGRLLVEDIRNRFYDGSTNAFWLTEPEHNQPLARTRDIFDNALPSATSSAIAAMSLAGIMLGDRNYTQIAQLSLQRNVRMMSEHGTAFGSMLQSMVLHTQDVWELVIVGPHPTPFLEVWRQSRRTDVHIFLRDQPGNVGPLFNDRPMISGETTAYLCSNGVCQLPVTEPQDIVMMLKNI